MFTMLKHWLTEKDGVTFCPVRMFSLVGIVEYMGLAAHSAIVTNTFDLQGFGTGLGIVLAAAGGSVAAKASTEKAE